MRQLNTKSIYELPRINWPMNGSLVGHLYVHVPFCVKKCAYCAFYSITGTVDQMSLWLNAIIAEIDQWEGRLAVPPKTLYFGGGTPSLLPTGLWDRLIDQLEERGLWPAEEISVECNPGTLRSDLAELLAEKGVSRISIGAQSFANKDLEVLGRTHRADDVVQAIETARRVGIKEIGIDLIFAIPGQGLEDWVENLNRVARLGAVHLSAYELTFEEQTQLTKRLEGGEIAIDEELSLQMLDYIEQWAEWAGFVRYEVSNWAKARENDGISSLYSCKHNQAYWSGVFYLGVGPAASSFVDGIRWTNLPDLAAYCRALLHGEPPPREWDIVSPQVRAAEIAGIGLRRTDGWYLDEFRERTGFDLLAEWAEPLRRMSELGWLLITKDRVVPTRLGLRFADAIARELLPDKAQSA